LPETVLKSYDFASVVKMTILFTRATCSIVQYLLGQRGWLAGWLYVTRLYCINTAKPILILFRLSGSPIILVSSDPCTNTQFQGEPLQRGR